MTVKVSKPAINVREELADLKKPTGIAGEAMLRAETPQEQFNLIGAGRRNLIINGAMTVAQRATSSTGNTASGFKTVDRFQMTYGGGTLGGTYDISQEADGPDGFKYCTKVTHKSASTSPNEYALRCFLEMQNIRCIFGKFVTFSFYYKSNRTGNHAVRVSHNNITGAVTKNIPFVVQSANTWELKTIVLDNFTAATTSSTSDNAWGIHVDMGFVMLGVGTTTVNADDYFQVTGVQLEVGKVATPFEHRSYGEELALCQRYTYVIGGSGVITLGGGSMYTSTAVNIDIPLPVQMRDVSPSLTAVPNGTGNWLNVYVGATGTLSNATPQVGDGVQASIRLYATNAHSGSSPSAAGAAVWCMVLAGAKLIISEEL